MVHARKWFRKSSTPLAKLPRVTLLSTAFLLAFLFLSLFPLVFSSIAHAVTASGGTIDLPETGQTTCYDAAGNVIAIFFNYNI